MDATGESPPLDVLRTETVRVQGIGKYTVPGYGGLEGQLTELRDPVTHYRFWVRESVKPPGGWFYVSSNHRWGLKGGAAMGADWVQVLELAVAPEIKTEWERIAALVRAHDDLGRPVVRNARFTKKTALYAFENENRDPWERLRRYRMSQQGNCPKCGEHLDYDGRVLAMDDGHSEPVTCPGCEWEGYENYRETFTGHEPRDPADKGRPSVPRESASEISELHKKNERLRHLLALAENWMGECGGADDPRTGLGSLLEKLRTELGPEGRYRGGYTIEPPPREDEDRSMRTYRLIYEIDIIGPSPEAAAEETWGWLQDPASIPPAFTVIDSDGNRTEVDLYQRGLDERGPGLESLDPA